MTTTVERPKSTPHAAGADAEPGVYARLGVPTFINASGHNTAQGGSLMPPEVVAAMSEAATRHVWLRALQDAAGRRIAELTGAPAAVVGSGAAGCILLGAAACLAGKDPERIVALPDTGPDARNEIVVWAASRPNYMYQACQSAGATLVEVGEVGGPVAPEDFGDALHRRSAGILLVLAPIDQAREHIPSWEDFVREVCGYADAADVPVLVDAASELPPRGLIQDLLALGVSGVIVSGGKAIRGPQSTGLLLGKKGLVEAAALNNNPHSAVGRPLKVGKEELCGAVAAVERFFAMDEAAQLAEFRERAQIIADAANRAGGSTVRAEVIERDPNYGRPPLVAKAVLRFTGKSRTAETLYKKLHDGEGGGAKINALRQRDDLIFNPMALEPGEAEIIAARLIALLH